MKKYIVMLLFLFQTFAYSVCESRAYDLAVGKSYSTLLSERILDAAPSPVYDFRCCCSAGIIERFMVDTILMTTIKLNPGMDKFTESLANQLEASDRKIHELVSLTYVNSMYSFYTSDTGASTLSSSVDGCGGSFNFNAKNHTAQFRREGLLKEILEVLYYWEKISNTKSIEAVKEIQMKETL